MDIKSFEQIVKTEKSQPDLREEPCHSSKCTLIARRRAGAHAGQPDIAICYLKRQRVEIVE